MKRLLTIALIAIGFIAQAQIAPYGGNQLRNYPDLTGAKTNFYLFAPATSTNKNGRDSLNYYPNAGQYVIQVADSVQDTVIFVPRTLPTNYVNDYVTVEYVTGNQSTANVRFRNKYNTVFKWSTAADSTSVPGAKKHVLYQFWYDGLYWNEVNKKTW